MESPGDLMRPQRKVLSAATSNFNSVKLFGYHDNMGSRKRNQRFAPETNTLWFQVSLDPKAEVTDQTDFS